MISKELFVETIKLMRKKAEHEHALISALELCSPQEYVNAFIYSEYEELVTKLLHESLELDPEDDDLEYWLYDCDFGLDFKIGNIGLEDGTTPDLTTPEKLYDYLTTNVKNKKQDEDYESYQEYIKNFYKWQADCEEQDEKERKEVQKD